MRTSSPLNAIFLHTLFNLETGLLHTDVRILDFDELKSVLHHLKLYDPMADLGHYLIGVTSAHGRALTDREFNM